MSSPKRQSPRTAIKEWLAHTEPESLAKIKPSIDRRDKDRASKDEPKQSLKPACGECSNRRFPAEQQRKRRHGRVHHVSENKNTNDPPEAVKTEQNLADQLGLHAPFRSFATRTADIPPQSQLDRERRKRRRQLSSSSSDLEPAACFREDMKKQDATEDAAAKQRRHDGRHENIDVLSLSNVIITSPKKPLKTYERRPRHKTREDRYELKENKKRNTSKADEKAARPKSKKSKKRKEKSGAALMHGFSAACVDSERLTLKAPKGLGLFGKGRASSPVRRRVPDLSFSELDFLNRRRDTPKEDPPAKQFRRKRDKVADTEAKISRFFAPPEERTHEAATSSSPRKCAAHPRSSSSMPPIDLPGKPFLGFGSCGPGHISPVALGDDFNQSIRLRRSSSDGPTSYATWSTTNPSTSRLPARLHRLSTENDLEMPPCTSSAARIPGHIQPEASNRDRRKARTTDGQDRTDGNRLAASQEPEHPFTGRRRPNVPTEETNKRQGERGVADCEEGHNVSSPKTALTSLLRSQNRPELLGAVLDALLRNTSADAPKEAEKPSVLKTSGEEQADATRAAETVPEIPAADEVRQSNAPDPPHPNGSVADVSEVPATTYQAHQSGLSQPLDRTPRYATGLSPQESYGQLPCQPPCEGVGSTKEEVTRSYGTAIQPAVQASIIRTGSANAWTGYRDLYQGQMEPVEARRGPHDNNVQDNAGISPDEATYLHKEPSEPSFGSFGDHPNRHHTLEEDWLDSHSGSRYFEADEANGWDDTNSIAPDRMDPLDQLPLQDLLFHDQGRQEQAFALDAADPSLEHFEEVMAEPDDLSYGAQTLQGSGTPKFLGSRALTGLHPETSSMWNSRKRPITREGIRASLACGGRYDLETIDDMPLCGFWRPNRLY
ncbi:MAG: hypothetical protein Q9177_004047 [Variospora cf. flavescens]